jgi:hypothetical protein
MYEDLYSTRQDPTEAADMTRLSALPSTREQARHALLLLGAPAPARFLVDVHCALFDGDLDMPGLAALLRSERRMQAPVVCHGLTADLAAAHVALAEWPLEQRIVTPIGVRRAALVAVVRIAEFAAMRPGSGGAAVRLLLRALASDVPGGPEAADVGLAARAALDDPEFVAALAAEAPQRAATAVRAAALDRTQQLFGVPPLPQQRNGG